MIRLHNDRTHRVEPFEPAGPVVTMYVCGPTVYDFAHLGHGKCYVSWDVVHRYLEYRGYTVKLAQNFTDIDDKIIRRAQEQGVEWHALAERFIREFFVDMDSLNVLRADVYPKATEHVADMVAHIEGLIAKGHAYAADGDVYFAVESFAHYGELSGRNLEQMQAGARVEVDAKKRHPMDFALWKASKPGEPSWESPWGPGRPGWHIECSAMVRKHLGDTIDIHTGGLDLTFPHHENEIAQSECLTGHTFARVWLHNGFVTMQAEKMSKSLGNFATLRELLEAYDPQVVRYFLLNVHYRQEVDFSDEGLKGAGAGLARLRKGLARHRDKRASVTPAVTALMTRIEDSFRAGMDEDFNTSRAIATFFDALRSIGDLKGVDADAAGHAVEVVDRLGGVLGIDLLAVPEESRDLDDVAKAIASLATEFGVAAEGPEAQLEGLIHRRAAAKAAKEWAVADGVRNRLKELGVALMDSKDGTTTWERAEPAVAGR